MSAFVAEMAAPGGATPPNYAFEKLTRRHGVKISPEQFCPLERCVLAVGEIAGCENIKSASRMNGAIVIFLKTTELVQKLVENGVVLNDTFTPVLPLSAPSRKITISNVPPFVRNEILERELARYGQVMSGIKRIPLGCKAPQLKHIVSFRRQVYMILNNINDDLNISLKFKIDNHDYVFFVTSESMKCFRCGSEGHIVRNCPEQEEEEEEERGAAGEGGETGSGPRPRPRARTRPQPQPRRGIAQADTEVAGGSGSNRLGRAASVADGETELIRGKDVQGQQIDGSIEAEGGEEAGSSTEGVAARAEAEETDGFDGNWRNQGGDRTDGD